MIDASNLPDVSEADAGTGPPANGSNGQAIPFFGFLNADYFPHE
jgi:hypothetical protein